MEELLRESEFKALRPGIVSSDHMHKERFEQEGVVLDVLQTVLEEFAYISQESAYAALAIVASEQAEGEGLRESFGKPIKYIENGEMKKGRVAPYFNESVLEIGGVRSGPVERCLKKAYDLCFEKVELDNNETTYRSGLDQIVYFKDGDAMSAQFKKEYAPRRTTVSFTKK